MSSKGKKPTLIDWLGYRRDPDFSDMEVLGACVGTIVGLTALGVVIGGIATIIQFLLVIFQANVSHEAVRNVGLIVAAVLGAPFVVWRALVAQKQADIAEQTHITDQINKAVAGLGTEKTVDRIGRPVKIYSGEVSNETLWIKNVKDFILPPSPDISKYRVHRPQESENILL